MSTSELNHLTFTYPERSFSLDVEEMCIRDSLDTTKSEGWVDNGDGTVTKTFKADANDNLSLIHIWTRSWRRSVCRVRHRLS